jgi:gluconate 5-dehydrogenase
MTELFSLRGRVALVTGASRGLGLAMARALAQAGAHVVLNGRRPETLEAAAKALSDAGLEASTAPFDVADEAAAKAAIEGIVEGHGRLDVLVGNAGINYREALADYATEEWRRVIDTNLTGSFVIAREAARPMVERGWGRIVFTASIMSFVARPGIAAYVASKTALAGLTHALAVELGPSGVTCNAIAPGYFVTEFTSALKDNAEFDAMVRQRTPLGRWGKPEELAGAVVFLASDAGAYVNGHLLTVDGGLSVAL